MTPLSTSLKVLVADDDADARSLVVSAISILGCQTIQACDGPDAIEVYLEQKPDVAVLDMMMPGCSGLDVCHKIRESEGGALVPIIMLTARDGLSEKVAALESGVDDYLTKPFHYQELLARIKALLRVRELNLKLQEKNFELQAMQARLIDQERALLVVQLAGTAAHELGQPLAAILLNTHLLEALPKDNPKHKQALVAIKDDAKRMAELISKLKKVDPNRTTEYYSGTEILEIGNPTKRSQT